MHVVQQARLNGESVSLRTDDKNKALDEPGNLSPLRCTTPYRLQVSVWELPVGKEAELPSPQCRAMLAMGMKSLLETKPMEVSLDTMELKNPDNGFRSELTLRYKSGQCYVDTGCGAHLCDDPARFVEGPFTVPVYETITLGYGDEQYPLTQKGTVQLNDTSHEPALLEEAWYWPKIFGIVLSGQ